jgi:hypothetical protein
MVYRTPIPDLRSRLLGFPVQAMNPAAWAELLQFHAARVVALVLGAGVVALLALGTGQVNYYAILFLCHFFVLLRLQTDGGEP